MGGRGESELKGVTMGVLATLHKLLGTETLEMWWEECMWLAGIFNLFYGPQRG